MATKSINKPRGGSVCAISTCVYYYGKAKKEGRTNISFHRFPKNLTYQKQWIQKCKRADKWNPSSAYICSVHFSDDDFIRDLKAELLGYTPKTRRLKPDAIPTLNLPGNCIQGDEVFSSTYNRKKRMEAKSSKQTSEIMDDDGMLSTTWDMCRTCGGESELPIYSEEGVEMQLAEKINTYLPITVSPNDDLPLALCKECVLKLESCHQIVTSCIATDSRLKQVIKLEDVSEGEEEYQDDGGNTVLSLQDEDGIYSAETTDNETEGPSNVFILKSQKKPAKENEEKGINDCHQFEESTEKSTDKDSNQLVEDCITTFQCDRCNFESNTQQAYVRHVETHNKNNLISSSFTCDLCNKRLSSRLSLTVHLRTHSGERPYKCQYCHRKFSQKPALKYHERRHTGEHPYVCSYCGKGFNSRIVQETHERVHTGERPFCCEECGAGFRCVSNLRQHQAIHSDSRPFICDVCGKHFRRPEKVRIHMRIHTGERPYSCPVCKRGFTQKGDMMKHTMIHIKAQIGNYSQDSIKVESDEGT